MATVKFDDMQTERFVQSAVIKNDNLWKSDTMQNWHYVKITLSAKVILCKKWRAKLIGLDLIRIGTDQVEIVRGLELSGSL